VTIDLVLEQESVCLADEIALLCQKRTIATARRVACDAAAVDAATDDGDVIERNGNVLVFRQSSDGFRSNALADGDHDHGLAIRTSVHRFDIRNLTIGCKDSAIIQ